MKLKFPLVLHVVTSFVKPSTRPDGNIKSRTSGNSVATGVVHSFCSQELPMRYSLCSSVCFPPLTRRGNRRTRGEWERRTWDVGKLQASRRVTKRDRRRLY